MPGLINQKVRYRCLHERLLQLYGVGEGPREASSVHREVLISGCALFSCSSVDQGFEVLPA